MISRLSPQAQTGIFVGSMGALLVAIPYGISYLQEHYYMHDNDNDENKTRPNVYNDIELLDDEMLSGLSTRVILDYTFDKETVENEEENLLGNASRFLSEVIYNEQTEETLKKLVLSVIMGYQYFKNGNNNRINQDGMGLIYTPEANGLSQ